VKRPTLAEKRNGPGYRDRLLTHEVRVFHACGVEGCGDPVYCVLTLYVDAHPPGRGWYEKLLRTLVLGVDTEVGLCMGHARDVIELDDEWATQPERWEPGRVNPPVMPGPGRLNG
jgi:hypothetical protein